MSNWAEQRRADRASEREQARLDQVAAAGLRRQEVEFRAEQTRKDRTDRRAERDQAKAEASDRREAVGAWVSARVVELLVYPLAVVSAVMAMPAMAAYGRDVYDNPTGVVLFVLSELGMWAFAAAVTVSRKRHPDRPTATLTAGVVVFAAVGFGLNFAHGYSDGVGVAVVMGVVSVSGVVAHQLVTAAPRRSRADRTRRRLERLAERKVGRARRLATRSAVVELDADGSAALVYVPGLYEPRRGRLVSVTVPGRPTDPLDDWDAALVGLLGDPEATGPTRLADPTTGPDQHGSGGVAVADPPPDRPRRRRRIDPQARRSLTPDEALKAARRLAQKTGQPVTADGLRKVLRIGAKTAREVRDQVNAELFGGAW